MSRPVEPSAGTLTGRKPPLVLASESPQRAALLRQVGIAFVTRPTGVAELSVGDPAEVVAENAQRKALAAAGIFRTGGNDMDGWTGGFSGVHPGETVLGADTVVALPGKILGKPADEPAARRHLECLSGRIHRVLTGVALVRGGAVAATAVEVTEVAVRVLDSDLLEWYLATGEWRGRAGGYAIQGAGAALVTGIVGDYANVVGLPLARLLALAPELLPRQAA